MKKLRFQKLGLSLGALAAGWMVKKVMETAYEKAFEENAPNKPEAQQPVSNFKMTLWTVLSGMAVSATKTLIKRKGGRRLDM